MQLSLFPEHDADQILEDLFQAYFDARKNKRNTFNALAFERCFEQELFHLMDDILDGNYTPRPSICFIVNRPVKREIFAADFRDRVVHHYIYNQIAPVFEKLFINDCYSCRKGKGTHYGIKRIDHFIRSCSRNYIRDCYVLKLDISGYFMSMNRKLLYEKVYAGLLRYSHKVQFDLPLVLGLTRKTIFHDPTHHCHIKGKQSNWQGLPKDKSLFSARPNCGLPIGNLTSQLFGNIYLTDFDHYVKRELGIRYYGRYVDDFVLIHQNREYLKSLVPVIRDYLQKHLQLTLHPKKVYLQHYTKGVNFLGAVIKPHRIYIANRTRGNFHDAIRQQNRTVQDHKPTPHQIHNFLCSMNSYMGILKHFKTYRFRKQLLFNHLSGWWWNYVYLSGGLSKLVCKRKLLV